MSGRADIQNLSLLDGFEALSEVSSMTAESSELAAAHGELLARYPVFLGMISAIEAEWDALPDSPEHPADELNIKMAKYGIFVAGAALLLALERAEQKT